MAAAASGSAPPPDDAGARKGHGRPRGSKSGSGRGRGRSQSLRWSKAPKRPRLSASPSGSPDGAHSTRRAVDLSAHLPPGTEVEVRVDDDGFHGSWFEATVLDFSPAHGYRHPARYTVSYVHLLADDDKGVLAEPFAPSHIRPRPPPPPPPTDPPRFQTHDIVEAFHIVVPVPDSTDSPDGTGAAGVTVAFPITREAVHEHLLRTSDDFVWPVDAMSHGRFTFDVEFLDLRIANNNAIESSSVWPNEGMVQKLASKSTLGCLSRMLTDSIHADMTINTTDGVLKAHKAVLAACSPVFESMFVHDLRDKESSTINISDMCLESCSALLGFIYGTIEQGHFKYGISEIKDCCEESLLEDISSENVLERLHVAWLYQLERLKKGCLTYLFVFGKIYDVRDEMHSFFHHADRELMLEMFQEVLSVWKPM